MHSFFARNRLSAYLDRSLPRSEAEAVAEAVARDMALSADLRAMKKALTLLQERGRVPAPTGFQARTLAAVAKQPVPGSQVAWLRRRLRRLPTEIVATLAAAAIVLIGLNARQDQAKAPATSPTPAAAPQPSREDVTAPTLAVDSVASQPSPVQEAPLPDTQATPPVEPTSERVRSQAAPTGPTPPALSAVQPQGFRILHGGDQIIYDLATIADEVGGRLVDVHGKLISPQPLDEGASFKQVYLVVPVAQAEAAQARLSGRSGLAPYPLDGPRPATTADETVFLIEAQM